MKKSWILALAIGMAVGCGGNQQNANNLGTNSLGGASNPTSATSAGKLFLTSGSGAKAIAASNDLGFTLLRTLAKDDETGNVIVSPISATGALGLLLNGASPELQKSALKALGLDGVGREDLNKAHKLLTETLVAGTDAQGLKLANSLWLPKGNAPAAGFTKANRANYSGQIAEVDWAGEGAAKPIEKWLNEMGGSKSKFAGKADGLLSIAAAYSRDPWKLDFDAAKTQAGEFTTVGGEKIETAMMSRIAAMDVAENEHSIVGKLPLPGSPKALYVILPKDGQSIADVLASLNTAAWAKTMSALKSGVVNLSMPKFQAEYVATIAPAKLPLGLTPTTTLTGVSKDPLKLDTLQARASFGVSEIEGASSPAAPDDAMMSISLNRPFVYLLQDEETKAILFAGVFRAPVKK